MPIRRFALIPVWAVLAACSPSDETLATRTNELLRDHLKGQDIQLVPLRAGSRITVPNVVSVDGSADGQCLSMSFARSDFDERFVRALFYTKDSKTLAQLPPFTEPGVEAILTADRVVFNLYSGVVMHLSLDLIYPNGVTPFRSKQVDASVVRVVGTAVHAGPNALPDALRAFVYLRHGKAFGFESREKDKQGSSEEKAQLADGIARMSLRFMPTVMDQPVDPQSVACNVKAFRG